MSKVQFKPGLLIDVEHWRERAEEARAIAEMFEEPLAKKAMLDIAAKYDKLVESAEWTLEHLKPTVED